jgi:hypothetical protein
MIELPVPEGVGRDVRPLERILEQVKYLLQAKLDEGLGPDAQRSSQALLGVDIFVVALRKATSRPSSSE